MNNSAKARATHLRRLAALEIARHRESEGLLGAALDGSLATGAVWPSSDLDFTVVPVAASERQRGVEWGEREGVVWHKHFNGAQMLRELVEGYPESFIRQAEGHFNADANWLLDGLAVMEVVEDPDGLLAETKCFVAAHRFTADVWEGRRAGLLEELRRLRDEGRAALDGGDPEQAFALMGKLTGFPAVAGQLWLEAAHRIYSSKAQDGQLAEVARAAGHPEVHALYRRALAVDPARAAAAESLLLDLGDWGTAFYEALGTLPLEDARLHKSAPILAAWVRHLTHTLSLAPAMGHPAYVYQRLDALRYWTAERPREVVGALTEQGVRGVAALETPISRVALLLEEMDDLLLGAEPAVERAQACLAAAEALLQLTERAL